MFIRTLAVISALAFPFATQAADFPLKDKTIKIVVPFPAGASTDTLARIVGGKLAERWGTTVIVENKGGAGGNVGTAMFAEAPPDGYTLLVTPPSPLVINKNLYSSLSFDPDTFVPITILATVPTVLTVRPDLKEAANVEALIEFAKQNPGKLNYASQGQGTTSHLTAEMFKAKASVDLVHVAYKGAAPALTDLMGGHVDLMFANLASALEPIKAGRLKALGVGSASRTRLLPDVPALAEEIPGFVSETWIGMVAPGGTPKEVVSTIAQEVQAVLQLPEVVAQVSALTADPVGSSPDETAKFIQEERERWGEVIRSAKVTIQ